MALLDDSSLEKLAMQEILKEAQRNADRAKEMGSLGWQQQGIPKANKRFLRNMLVSTLRNPFSRKPRIVRSASREKECNHSRYSRKNSSDSDRHHSPKRDRRKSYDDSDNEKFYRRRRSRDRSKESNSKDSYKRKRRKNSHDSDTDSSHKCEKRSHSRDDKKYHHRHSGSFKGQGYRRGRFPGHGRGHFYNGNIPHEDIDEYYHSQYMSYMKNYKKHMEFYNQLDDLKKETEFQRMNESKFDFDSDSDLSTASSKSFSDIDQEGQSSIKQRKKKKVFKVTENDEENKSDIQCNKIKRNAKIKLERDKTKSKHANRKRKKETDESVNGQKRKSPISEIEDVWDNQFSAKNSRSERRVKKKSWKEKKSNIEIEKLDLIDSGDNRQEDVSDCISNHSSAGGDKGEETNFAQASTHKKKSKEKGQKDKIIQRKVESKILELLFPNLSEGEIIDDDSEETSDKVKEIGNKRKRSKHKKHKHKKHKRKT